MAGTVVITGANGSLALGLIDALLARYPQHTIIAALRNPSPDKDANTAKLVQIISKYQGGKVILEPLDLGQLSLEARLLLDLSFLIGIDSLARD